MLLNWILYQWHAQMWYHYIDLYDASIEQKLKLELLEEKQRYHYFMMIAYRAAVKRRVSKWKKQFVNR